VFSRTATRRSRTRNGGPSDPAQPFGDVVQVFTGGGRGGVGRLHLGVDLGAVHLDATWRFNTQTDGIAPDIEYDDANVITDHDAFPGAACQDQHCGLPPWTPPKRLRRRTPETCGRLQAVRRC